MHDLVTNVVLLPEGFTGHVDVPLGSSPYRTIRFVRNPVSNTAVHKHAGSRLIVWEGRKDALREIRDGTPEADFHTVKTKAMRHLEAIKFEDRMAGRFMALTPKEREVLVCMVSGFKGSSIPRILEVSKETVRTQIKSIFAKLEVDNQSAAVALAIRYGGYRPDFSRMMRQTS